MHFVRGFSLLSQPALLAAPFCVVLAACGARSDLSYLGVGGAGTTVGVTTVSVATSTHATSTGAGGGTPHCDPPKAVTQIAKGLDGALEVLVRGDLAYVLRNNDVVEAQLCGGGFKTLASNANGYSSLRGFAVVADGVYWASNGPGTGNLELAPLDGGTPQTEPVPGILSVAADDQGVYYGTQAGSLYAATKSNGTITLFNQDAIGYWAPLVVDSGWLYWAAAGSNPFGNLIRVRPDNSVVFPLVPLRIPDDVAVNGDQVFTVTAHGVDELQSFDATNPMIDAIAVVPTPVAVAVDDNYVYVADEIGIERSPHDGSNVQPLIGQVGMLDVTVTDTALVWIADDGTLSWVKKPM